MITQFQFAIVGCGRIAIRHAEQIAAMGHLVAVCDTDSEKAASLAKVFNAKAYTSIEQMIADEPSIQIVSICTPNFLHAEQSIFCLQKGKHVLCEKPMSISLSDANKMIEAAASSGYKLFVVKSSRYTPIVQALKNCIDKNLLGKIYSFQLNCVWNRSANYYESEWRGDLIKDGGTLYTQFSHYIDVLLWLLNEEATEVSGFRSNLSDKKIDFEDTGTFSVKMKSGALGSIHYSVNAFEKNQEISLSIIAEKGTIKLGGEYMNEVIYQHPILIDEHLQNLNNPANDYGEYRGSMSNHDKVYVNLINELNGNESLIADGESAAKSIAFIEKIYQQIKL